jgi:hypothetical protein
VCRRALGIKPPPEEIQEKQRHYKRCYAAQRKFQKSIAKRASTDPETAHDA